MVADDAERNSKSGSETPAAAAADNQKSAKAETASGSKPAAGQRPTISLNRPNPRDARAGAAPQSTTQQPTKPETPRTEAASTPSAAQEAMSEAARRLRLVPMRDKGASAPQQASASDSATGAPPVSTSEVARASGDTAERALNERPIDRLRERMNEGKGEAAAVAASATAAAGGAAQAAAQSAPSPGEPSPKSSAAPSQPAPFTQPADEEPKWKPEDSRGPWLPILVALLALSAFGLSLWFGYTQKNQILEEDDLPVVQADAEPERTAAGEDVNPPVTDQDKTIYEKVDGTKLSAPASDQEDQLQPPSEQPLSPEAREAALQPPLTTEDSGTPSADSDITQTALQPPASTDTDAASTTSAVLEAPKEETPATTASGTEDTGTPAGADTSGADATGAVTQAGDEDTTSTQTAAASDATTPAPAESEASEEASETDSGATPSAEATPATATNAVDNQTPTAATSQTLTQNELSQMPFRIQLGSFRTPGQAERGWNAVQSAHSELLNGVPHYVARVDLGGERGVFHRLQAGGFPDQQAAKAICDWLASQNQACLVVRHRP